MDWIARLTGIKRCLILFITGGVMALAMPPFGFFLVLAIGLPFLFWALDGAASVKYAFFDGWLFGLGFFTAGLYWIAAALFVDLGATWWALPFALFGLPAYLAIYIGLPSAILYRFRPNHRLIQILFFIILLSMFGVLRGFLFTGFPWNSFGYTWDTVLPVLQIASVTGIHGLSLLTLCLAFVPVIWVAGYKTIAIMPVIVFIGMAGWGQARLTAHPPDWMDRPNTIRIVQPSIPQADKWDREQMPIHLARHLELSENNRPNTVRTVIWPETAIGYLIENNQKLRWQIANFMPENGILITGALRTDNGNYFNSILAVGKNGQILESYDKTHLVPFGEYLPLEDYLPVNPIASLGAQFSKGNLRPVIRINDLPGFSPLICYEVIFSGAVIANPDNRPNWLLNVTNDAWYGTTTGPYQHLAIARVRAIEEGVPLLRAANNGISAMIGPTGRIGGKLTLNEIGVIDTPLPDTLSRPTFFARYGHGVIGALWLIMACFIAGGYGMTGLFRFSG